jgi:UDP-N-acetylmuramyl tripeptide synthase
MDDATHRLDALSHAADVPSCRVCGHDLAYHALYLSHLGDWYCPNCGQARPALDIAARDIRLEGVKALALTVDSLGGGGTAASLPHTSLTLNVPLPGLYNAYNTLAAAAATLAFGVDPAAVASGLAGFTAAFGRIERVELEGREIVLALVKNPTGFNEVLRMLVGGGAEPDAGLTTPTMLSINDLDADGRDVSWLWDVDFEILSSGDAPLHTAGIRGPVMAVRLKYAGVAQERIVAHPPGELRAALLDFVRAAPVGANLYILPTYTAMLETRRIFADLGAVRDFWQQ